MKLKIVSLILTVMISGSILLAQEHSISSPDGRTVVKIQTGETLLYSVSRNGCSVVNNCPISLTIKGRAPLGKNVQVIKASRRTVNQELKPVVPVRKR